MEINILLILLVILALWRAWKGFRNGLADEINRLVSLVAALFVLALAVMIIYGVMENNMGNVITAAVVLVITGILFHLLSLVLKSLKTIAKLPIISFLNSILGIGIGLAETVVACWIMYCVIQFFPTGDFGTRIMEWTYENEYLLKLYEANYFLKMLTGL